MRRLGKSTLARLGLGAALLAGCPGPADPDPPIAEEVLGPIGSIVPHATDAQRETFERGRAVVEHRYTFEEGLGPSFNMSFCGGCHERPLAGGSAGHYRDFLLVQQRLSDGSQTPVGVNGVQVHFDRDAGRRADAEGANVRALRNPIPFFGTGALAEIEEAAILRNADPDDADGDGISGRPNYDRGFVGRFGRKAQTVSIEGFIRGPLFNHLGITSEPLTEEMKARLPVPSASPGSGVVTREGARAIVAAQASAPDEPTLDDDGVPDPELSAQQLFDVVSFSMLLAAPRPDEPTVESEAGRALFEDLHCTGCHVPALRGPRGMVPAWSDLLLHDMGEALADGIEMGVATGSEFRTQPLWGIVATGPYLHDGRAATLDEAILWHGGEARGSREAYEALGEDERALVLAFLESLGGRDVATPGLLPPGAPVPAPGEAGGPIAALSEADLARFVRGRQEFDRDHGHRAGLGPFFNGDSCRACHFDPVIGGAGPADVNVTRQAILVGGAPTAPAGGTMAHRFATSAVRPPIDEAADFFELRQTPTILGLGLVERIPEALVLAGEDPDDEDGDGISGRAHRLADGRLGRLGWKADVPDLAEFARDAMTNELGLTVPDQPGLTFGAGADDDDADDPEISGEDLDAIVFFMRSLAPPPRSRADVALEDRGEAIFEDVGCADCHATLSLEDGTPVPLYSDLLLHDVFEEGGVGVPAGDASGRELRTPPLWGLARTGPYMHDGRSGTLEDAVSRHGGEAAAGTAAVAALSAEDRAALLAFLASL